MPLKALMQSKTVARNLWLLCAVVTSLVSGHLFGIGAPKKFPVPTVIVFVIATYSWYRFRLAKEAA